MFHRVPITFELPQMALPKSKAAKCLGVGRTKLWQLVALGKIRQTSYGTIPLAELDRHLKEETANRMAKIQR